MSKPKMYFIVWRPDSTCAPNPTFKHTTKALAQCEAERLARSFGGEFIVMAACGGARRMDIELLDFDQPDDGVPF